MESLSYKISYNLYRQCEAKNTMKSSRNKTNKQLKNKKNDEFSFRTFDDSSTADETADKTPEEVSPSIEEQQAELEKQLKARKAAKRLGFEFKSFGSELDQQLWQACKDNDLSKAEALLKEGANPEFKPSPNDLSALDYAVTHQNAELAYLLIDEGDANFKKSKLFLENTDIQHAVLLAKYADYTSSSSELCELVNDLLNLGLKPTERLLEFAIFRKDMTLIYQFCMHGAPLDTNHFFEIQKIAEEKKDEPHIAELVKEIKRIIKEPMVEAKNRIIRNSLQLNYFDSHKKMITDVDIKAALENPIATIAKEIYHEIPDRKQALVERLKQESLQQDSILMPLLKLIALTSLGIHQNPHNKKPLKTLISSQPTVEEFALGGESALGIYAQKNTVFIGTHYLDAPTNHPEQTKQVNLDLQACVVFHEWKHFCDNELFGNSFITATDADQEKYAAVFEKTRQQINDYQPDNKTTDGIKNSFLNVFNAYQKTLQHVELLARVPEVLGLLGVQQGYQWLKTNTPDLLTFYETRYNQYINDYLYKQQQHLLPPLHPTSKNQ